MNIKVEFIGFPDLKKIMGTKIIEIDLPGESFSDLISFLESKYKNDFKEAVLNNSGSVDTTVQILRNGKAWIERNDRSQHLEEGDKIILMRMLAGG